MIRLWLRRLLGIEQELADLREAHDKTLELLKGTVKQLNHNSTLMKWCVDDYPPLRSVVRRRVEHQRKTGKGDKVA